MIEIDRYVDLTGVHLNDLLCPNLAQHQVGITTYGTVLFSLPPYSLTQMGTDQGKSDWFYVDTGGDGHAIRGFDKAKMVLEQTMKGCHEKELREVEKL